MSSLTRRNIPRRAASPKNLTLKISPSRKSKAKGRKPDTRHREPVFTAAVVTVSDSSSLGERKDLSGPAVAEALGKHASFQVVFRGVVPDDQATIEKTLSELSEKVRLVVTTGGTGIAPRDVTPEATRAVCDKLVEGIAERMRREGSKKTRYAALSRGVCGVRGTSLILNLPGNPTGAVDSLQAVMDLLPHALALLSGNTTHDHQATT